MSHLFISSINIYIFILEFQFLFFNYLQNIPLTASSGYIGLLKICSHQLFLYALSSVKFYFDISSVLHFNYYAQFLLIILHDFILYAHFINID